MVKGLFVDGASKHGNDLRLKNQIDRSQDQAAHNRHHYGIANASSGRVFLVLAKINANESAATVSDHDGNRQGDHCKRKNNGIGRISVRTQI